MKPSPTTRHPYSFVRILAHTEGLLVLCLCLTYYHYVGFGWTFFMLLFFTPDLSMLGYLLNPAFGSVIYNLFHTYTTAILLIFIGMLLNLPLAISLGLIFMAHIGLDRFLGFGLKYPSSFNDTHLHRL